MKKFLSLVLASAMMSTMAFAASMPNEAEPYSEMYLEHDDFYYEETNQKLGDVIPDVSEEFNKYDFCSDNFTFKITYKKGAELIEEAYIDNDAGELVINLKKNNLLKRPETPNLVFEKIEVKSRRTIKNGSKYVLKAGKTFVAKKFLNFECKVGYDPEGPNLSLKKDDYDYHEIDSIGGSELKDGVYITVKDMKKDTANRSTQPKATLTIPVGDARIETKVFAGDKFFFKYDDSCKRAMDVIRANEDYDLTVYDIESDGLVSMKLWLEDLEEDNANIYIYDRYTKQLTEADAKFDEEELCYYTVIHGDAIVVTCEDKLEGVVAHANELVNPETGR